MLRQAQISTPSATCEETMIGLRNPCLLLLLGCGPPWALRIRLPSRSALPIVSLLDAMDQYSPNYDEVFIEVGKRLLARRGGQTRSPRWSAGSDVGKASGSLS
jgi:hypothetical protein